MHTQQTSRLSLYNGARNIHRSQAKRTGEPVREPQRVSTQPHTQKSWVRERVALNNKKVNPFRRRRRKRQEKKEATEIIQYNRRLELLYLKSLRIYVIIPQHTNSMLPQQHFSLSSSLFFFILPFNFRQIIFLTFSHV